MLTLKQVNNAIAKAGFNEVLVAGDGYYYFIEGDAFQWESSSVYVYRLNHLSLDQWLAAHKALRTAYANSLENFGRS